MPTLRMPARPHGEEERALSPGSFSLNPQPPSHWHVFLIIIYIIILGVYYQFAALTWLFSRLRGKLRHRTNRLAFYSPLVSHTFLLPCLCLLDGGGQELAYLLWQVGQLVAGAAADVSLLLNAEDDDMIFTGCLLNATCFAVVNLLFYLRWLDKPHVWESTATSSCRTNFWVAICFDLIYLGGYMCEPLRLSISAMRGEKED
ncbi:hypothetical protein KC353_g88 [Hortaea werneckii]|nr:hypothetical protein KC353_g88 [Hortaea werneckii]